MGVPPVEFEKLVHAVEPNLIIPGIDALLILKRETPELGKGDKIPEINQFIEEDLQTHASRFTGQGRSDLLTNDGLLKPLNGAFRKNS